MNQMLTVTQTGAR